MRQKLFFQALRSVPRAGIMECGNTGYSVRSAVTGSLLAAFLEGIRPPSSVSSTLKPISMTAGTTGSTALTSAVPAR